MQQNLCVSFQATKQVQPFPSFDLSPKLAKHKHQTTLQNDQGIVTSNHHNTGKLFFVLHFFHLAFTLVPCLSGPTPLPRKGQTLVATREAVAFLSFLPGKFDNSFSIQS